MKFERTEWSFEIERISFGKLLIQSTEYKGTKKIRCTSRMKASVVSKRFQKDENGSCIYNRDLASENIEQSNRYE
jgi:hypothetical protein